MLVRVLALRRNGFPRFWLLRLVPPRERATPRLQAPPTPRQRVGAAVYPFGNAAGMGAAAAGTIRYKRCVERRKAGLAVYQIEVDHVGLVEALKTANLLHPDNEDDPEAVGRALNLAVHIFVLDNTEST